MEGCFSRNCSAGISIEGQNIDIINNSIKGNGFGGSKYNVGVYIKSGSQNVNVNDNNIESNAAGLTNVAPAEVDATRNWWGHASGPSGEGGRINPAGITIGKGDAVSINVNWDPWLPKPVGLGR